METEQHVKVGGLLSQAGPGTATDGYFEMYEDSPKTFLFASWGLVDPMKSGFGA